MRALIAATVLALALGTAPAHAADENATYVAGYVQLNIPGTTTGVGGYQFPAGVQPKSVRVVDATGPGSTVYVCQDTNGNATCGESGEPLFLTCATGTFQTLPPSFSTSKPTFVFVLVVYDLVCEGTPTTGTITLRR